MARSDVRPSGFTSPAKTPRAFSQQPRLEVVLGLAMDELLHGTMLVDEALHRLQVLLRSGHAVGLGGARAHGSSAAGMRARITWVLRISHRVLRLRS